jgi:CheY-like chemotaxis protein
LIFQPFSQADSSTTRQYGGTGLGLSISKQLVHMMGGEIGVETVSGQGSQFHFSVRVQTARRGQAGSAGPPVHLQGVRVLIVDDNRTNRRILDATLRLWKMRPTCAEGGPEALDALSIAVRAADPYRLVITDLHMPGMDGFTFVEQSKRRSGSNSVTIMMLSSAAHQSDLARCRELGISGYLLKPVRQCELLEAVAEALSNKTESRPIPLPPPSEPTSVSPAVSLRILVAEDNHVNQRLVLRMLEIRGHTVTVADNGRQALEKLKNEDFDLVLMDVQMPLMSGVEATAAIRHSEQNVAAHLPIVALTAHAMKGDREKYLSSGMDGYLAKPIRARELDEILGCYTRQVAARREGQMERSVK